MNTKPDWANAPSWARYLAQDQYGAWGWYEKKPVIDLDYGLWDIDDVSHKWVRPDDIDFEADFEENDGFAETLESRPRG